MKRLLLLLPLVALLSACQSKQDICALHASRQISTKEAATKLGVKEQQGSYLPALVRQFCSYYRK